MLITPDYCRLMARYNAWQNDGLFHLLDGVAPAVLTAPRGAYFGSILATLNHLLWADLVWLGRLTGGDIPAGGVKDSTTLTATFGDWAGLRFRTDGRLTLWAEGLRAVDLTGNLTWHSAAVGGKATRPVAALVVHMFNHQTHHRGQVHAMLTAAGLHPQDTDLFLLPPEVS